MRSLCLALAAAVLYPAAVSAEAPTIQHTAVKCIVAGKYPKLEAAFAPAPIARARSYFRPEGVPSWYYVEMAAEPASPAAYAGVLPKPTKKLVGKKIEYYLEASSKSFDTGRTLEYAPQVVAREEDCKDQPIAAYASGPPAGVFPNLPEGFAVAGTFPVAAVAIVGGGAAAATTVVLLKDDEEAPAVTSATQPQIVVPTPTPTPVPVTTLAGFQVACQAQPRQGVAPLRVLFGASASGGTGVYDFAWTFGDGETSNQVSPGHTYQRAGTYQAVVTVTSGASSGRCERSIVVDPLQTDFQLTVLKAGTGAGTVTGPLINCGLDCTQIYPSGTVAQLTAEPNQGTLFVGWSGGCSGSGQCFVTMDQDKTVTATFGLVSTLNVALAGTGSGSVAGPGIACGTDCSEQFVQGDVVTLTPTAAVGSTFGGWSGACTGTGTCTVTMSGAVNVTATFVAITPQLTVVRAGSGAAFGAVAGPGINCGTDCTEIYPFGENVTVAPSPVPSSPPVEFDGFSGDCTGQTCTVIMTAARNVTATFTRLFNLNVQFSTRGVVTSDDGAIDCPKDCFEQYRSGAVVRLTAVPNPDNFFIRWDGDCTGTDPNNCVLTMTADRNVTPIFAGVPTLRGGMSPRAGDVTLRWSSQLDVEGGWGRVTSNGSDVGSAGVGRTTLSVVTRSGANRVEAQLAGSTGKGGSWRFELLDRGSLEPSSLHVLEGEVLLVTEDAIVFRLAGRPGERVAFTFRTKG